ncbi:uncharacterized protein [Setaria viridis]
MGCCRACDTVTRPRPILYHSAHQPQVVKPTPGEGRLDRWSPRRRWASPTYPTHGDPPRRRLLHGAIPLSRSTASTPPSFQMASEDLKDMLKNVDWKTVGGAVTTESSQPVIKKRLPKKIRQVPECYFLPRRSLPSALAIYGAVCAAGVGAGMLLEVWINKKIKEDGGIIWEMDK